MTLQQCKALWPVTLWETFLSVAVVISTAFTIFIITLPSTYTLFDFHELDEDSFSNEDKQNLDSSGYSYFQHNRDEQGKLKINVQVQVVVLGDMYVVTSFYV